MTAIITPLHESSARSRTESRDGLAQYTAVATETSHIETPTVLTRHEVETTDEVERATEQRISIDELYEAREAIRNELGMALALLADARGMVTTALRAFHAGDELRADDQMQQLFSLLPELFCCRTLSDSFGAVINALFHSLKNLEGTPPTADQMKTILKVLSQVRDEPFMPFASAVDLVGLLEEAGLITEPSAIEFLSDWLDE
jgi:hypothetical protein